MALLDEKYRNLISGRSRGALADTARVVLSLLSVPYRCLVAGRNAYFRRVKPAARRIARPVFSVGNITGRKRRGRKRGQKRMVLPPYL